MLFDSPEIKKMMEQENEFLAKGKIDWISRILPIAKRILECVDRLSDDDFPDYSSKLAESYSCEEDRIVKKNDFYNSQKLQLTQSKKELDELIKHIADKAHNDKVETLANKIKTWENRQLTPEEQKRENQIVEDNLILAKAEFFSRIEKPDDSISEILKKAQGLKYRELLPDQYAWKDVALSMLKFPEQVLFDFDDCPYCGKKQIKLYFHSPKWTWAMMCGIAGEMVFCPQCTIQTRIIETMRN